MRFKAGQQVVCVNDVHWSLGAGPKMGDVVTVHKYANSSNFHISLVEWPEFGTNSDGGLGRRVFYENYFEPLVEITELTEILEHQTQEL